MSRPTISRRPTRNPARRAATESAQRASGRTGRRRAAPRAADPARARAARFRRRRLIALVAAALLVAGLVFGARFLLLDSGLFAVHDVEVVGGSAVPAEAVRAAAAVELGTPLVAVDTTAVAGRVAGVPGVGSAEVSRAWPSRLVVRITERTAVALSAGTTERRLVDATGLAYAPAPDPAPALPSLEVAAPAPDDPTTVAALRVLAAVPEPVRRDLVAVAAGSPDAVTLRLTGDRTVRWGTAEDSARKAAVLVPLLTRPGSVYDVASPDLPTVRR